jgi:hypothetical protein
MIKSSMAASGPNTLVIGGEQTVLISTTLNPAASAHFSMLDELFRR